MRASATRSSGAPAAGDRRVYAVRRAPPRRPGPRRDATLPYTVALVDSRGRAHDEQRRRLPTRRRSRSAWPCASTWKPLSDGRNLPQFAPRVGSGRRHRPVGTADRMSMEIDLGSRRPSEVPRRAAAVARGEPARRPRRQRRPAAVDVRGRSRGHGVDRASSHDAGYLCVGWPKEYGGRGLSGVEVAVLNEEFARARRAARDARHGRVAGRPVDHRARHRRAEGLLPAPHHRRHRPLLPGLLRARRRLGPRRAQDARRRRRRRGRDHRSEGVDLGRADGEHDVLPVPHRSGRAEAPWHLVRARADEAARRRVERVRAATDPADHRHERLHRDVHHRGARAAVQRDRRAAQRLAGDDDDARQRARRQRHDPARAVPEAVLAARRGGAPSSERSDDPLVRQELAWAYTHAEIMRYAGPAHAVGGRGAEGARARARRSTRCSGPSTRATSASG